MDWFEHLTGFREEAYELTRAKLFAEGGRLRSLVNNRSFQVGELELVSLQQLRQRAQRVQVGGVPVRVRNVIGEARKLHRDPQHAGSLIQVASQFNLLEMVSEEVTPADGVTGYRYDPTQGPACAIAAGAATIYRNYFAQTPDDQLDAIRDLGLGLAGGIGCSIDDLWKMRNGYAMCTPEGLGRIGSYLKSVDEDERDRLRSLLRIGLHWDVEVTDQTAEDFSPGPILSQAFCSALPISYCGFKSPHWEIWATLVLEAAYEATLLAGVINADKNTGAPGANRVLLTLLGGGAFGNSPAWITSAIKRAIDVVAESGLQIDLVSHREIPRSLLVLER